MCLYSNHVPEEAIKIPDILLTSDNEPIKCTSPIIDSGSSINIEGKPWGELFLKLLDDEVILKSIAIFTQIYF